MTEYPNGFLWENWHSRIRRLPPNAGYIDGVFISAPIRLADGNEVFFVDVPHDTPTSMQPGIYVYSMYSPAAIDANDDTIRAIVQGISAVLDQEYEPLPHTDPDVSDLLTHFSLTYRGRTTKGFEIFALEPLIRDLEVHYTLD